MKKQPIVSLRASLLMGLVVCMVLAACSDGSKAERLKERQTKAMTIWQDRCKRSGEFIHRTVDNVSGIYLIKVRPKGVNFDDQFGLDDPYGHDFGGDAYIRSFLRGHYRFNVKDIREGGPPRRGYLYVETHGMADGERYRYTGGVKAVRQKDVKALGVLRELQLNPNYDLNIYDFVMDKMLVTGDPPRYAVTYDDISTPEEREYWVAGSSLKVIDRQTGEVIAERIGFMVDRGQGNRSGGRAPWLFAAANACPSFARNFKNTNAGTEGMAPAQTYQTLDFVEKVLKPSN